MTFTDEIAEQIEQQIINAWGAAPIGHPQDLLSAWKRWVLRFEQSFLPLDKRDPECDLLSLPVSLDQNK